MRQNNKMASFTYNFIPIINPDIYFSVVIKNPAAISFQSCGDNSLMNPFVMVPPSCNTTPYSLDMDVLNLFTVCSIQDLAILPCNKFFKSHFLPPSFIKPYSCFLREF